jgi:hypothetical protein
MERHSSPQKPSGLSTRFFLLGLALAGLGSLAALYQLVMLAVEKIRAGKGFDTYHTFWLVEFSYVGFLILFGAVLLAAIVSLCFWWREERLWRDFERKYGSHSDA